MKPSTRSYYRSVKSKLQTRLESFIYINSEQMSQTRQILLCLQISFGSERRHMSSWLEGFAKLHSFKLDGPKVLLTKVSSWCPLTAAGFVQRKNARVAELCGECGEGGAGADGHLEQVRQRRGRVDLVGEAPHHLQDVSRRRNGCDRLIASLMTQFFVTRHTWFLCVLMSTE